MDIWIDGVSVTLSNGAVTTTSGGGHYSFLDVEGGTYTITISGYPGDASFSATTAEVTIATSGQTAAANFSGAWIRTASLMGMVTVEGTGLPGITVSITGRQDAQMLTDDNGQYTFTGLRAGNYTVEITGYDAADVAFSATSSAVTVSAGESKVWSFDGTFVRESAISGQVSVEGNGLSDVTVSLRGMGSDDEQMTDMGGQYTFSNLRAGEYQLGISGYDTDEYGFSTTSATVRVEHGRTANVPFEGILLRTATIMGQVSIEGEGLADVTVSLSGEGESLTTMTDAGGQYTFSELPAGNFAVGISGYDTDDYSFETTSKNVAVALGGTATVPFEGILLRTSGIAGRVSVDGMGIEDVTVTLSGDDLEAPLTAMTDATGQYAIAGLAEGDYTVAISGYDAVEYAFEDSQDVTLAKDATAIVNFTGKKLRTAEVMVTVTADGAGVPGVRADLIHITNLATLSGSIIKAGATGANGSYTFDELLAGAYAVQISGADEEIDFLTTLLPTQVATDATAEVTFPGRINRTASIGGMVTVNGAGMAGVMVALSGGDDGVAMSSESGDDGSYSFGGLRRGDYTVAITNPDEDMYNFATTSRDVSVGVGQVQTDVSFAGTQVMQSSISGTVTVEGEALSGVTVTLGGDGDDTQTTGANGAYDFDNLGSGTYTVTIANPDGAAYIFDTEPVTVELGNTDRQTRDFGGTHTREASVTGMLFVDEGTPNNLHDEGEHALAAEGIKVTLVGPTLLKREEKETNADGMFTFDELRQGDYQLMLSAPGDAVMDDFMYGGDASYDIEVGVGADGGGTQNLPYDITHQTINFTVNLRSGEDPGDELPGAMVTLYSDAAGELKIAAEGTGETDADGEASLRFERDGTTGNTVYAAIAAPAGDYHADDAMQAITWNSQERMTDAANDGDIVNLMADFEFSGATITTDMGGGEALGEWAISVSSGDDAVDGAPEALGADGTASFSEVVDAADLPKTYKVAMAADQTNTLDGGSKYSAGDGLEYTHTGLYLPATMDAGMMEVAYTTQTLKVYVHHERDQVMGFTGNVLGGDARASGVLDIGIRHIERSSGRSRAFLSTDKIAPNLGKANAGVYVFSNVPADAQVIVTADVVAGQNVKLLGEDELDAYTGQDANGMTGGAFGDNGGYHHTVELCPLMSGDGDQRHGECGTFAFVNTYAVDGQVWEWTVGDGDNGTFADPKKTRFVGVTVDLEPVAGENLAYDMGEPAGDKESYTSGTDNPDTKATTDGPLKDGRHNEAIFFNVPDWGRKAAGEYKLEVTPGWKERIGEPGTDIAFGDALSPLDGDLRIDVSPTTGYVYGVVEDDYGFRVKGATVSANGATGTTDDFGRYRIRGFSKATVNKVPDQVAIRVSMTGFDPGIAVIDFAANAPTQQDFELTGEMATATITGTVRRDGEPEAGVTITVNGGRPLGATADLKTDGNGVYTATVPVGDVKIAAAKTGMSFFPEERTVTTTEGNTVSGIDFTAYRHGTITGRVLNENDGPMSGVTVSAIPAGGGDVADSDETDVRGVYSLSVPFGRYTVAVEAAGFRFATEDGNASVSVNVAEGETESVEDFEATRELGTTATLSALSLGADVSLVEDFAADAFEYTADAAHTITSVTVTATADDNATVAIAATGDAEDADQSNGRTVDLDVGETTITLTVTSEDEMDEQVYEVVVDRANAMVTLSAAPNPVAEGGEATITATVDHPQAEEFTVTVATTTVDAELSTNKVLTFAADATTSTGVVTVTAPNDILRNDDPTSTVTDIEVTGTGAWSDAATMTTAPMVDDLTINVTDDEMVASAPRNVEVTTVGDGSATVTWSSPSQIGTVAIDTYEWELTAPGSSATGTVEANAALEAPFTDLTNGVEYTFSVFARSDFGDGDAASTTVKTQPDITVSTGADALTEGGVVTDGNQTPDTTSAWAMLSSPSMEDITVTITVSDDALATVTDAELFFAAGQQLPADSALITAVDNDVRTEEDGTSDVEVSGESDNATAPTTPVMITITDDDTLPGTPTALAAAAESGGLLLTWTLGATGWGNAPAATRKFQYRVKKVTDGVIEDPADAGLWTDVDGGDLARSVRVSGLDAEEYNVEVRAVTAAGNSSTDTATGTPTAE